MHNDLLARAEDLLPEGTDADLRAAAVELATWIREHAAVVRSMGRPAVMRAILTVARSGDAIELEADFVGRRGEVYGVRVIGSGEHRLVGRCAQAVDAAAAAAAIAALLDELGMPAVLA